MQLTAFAGLNPAPPSPTTPSRRQPFRTTSVCSTITTAILFNYCVKSRLGDLRKGVDFSDPKLPKMTMTTFDGQPYIEQYSLSKLEILPDFGTEQKAAPTPVRLSFIARVSYLKAACCYVLRQRRCLRPAARAHAAVTPTCCRAAPCSGGTPSSQARAQAFNSKTEHFTLFDLLTCAAHWSVLHTT